MSTDPKFQLRLLGGFGLCDPTPSHGAIVISSKKARALLAYVAMQEPMRVHRERLATLFWPDRVDRQAAKLRQCLASLRGISRAAPTSYWQWTARHRDKGRSHRRCASAARVFRYGQRSDARRRGSFMPRTILSDLAMEGEEFCELGDVGACTIRCGRRLILSELASRAERRRRRQRAASRIAAHCDRPFSRRLAEAELENIGAPCRTRRSSRAGAAFHLPFEGRA